MLQLYCDVAAPQPVLAYPLLPQVLAVKLKGLHFTVPKQLA
jgi:hypothetical protein